MAVKEAPVEGIAYVNLKKKAECKRSSVDSDIRQYVESDWQFVSRQIEILNPRLLFFCGTFRFVRPRMEFLEIAERVFRVGDQTVYHPSCRIGYARTFSELTRCVAHLTSA